MVVVPAGGWRPAEADDAEGGRLIVGFAPSAIGTTATSEAHEEAGGEPVEQIDDISAEVVEVDDVAEAVDAYVDQPGVRYVEVDHAASAFVNDPLYTHQWSLKPVSEANKGTSNAEAAWAKSKGKDVVVAVVDTGVRTGGTDLDAARVLPGRDLVNDDNDATDDNGHGTHVAGTVAQSTDNDRGVAGVAPDAKILPVKVLNALGAGFYSDIVDGIVWAKDNGADVINLSLGSYEFSQALCDAVTNAVNAGVVVVAAVGNDGIDGIAYPAACDAAIAVGSVRYDGARAGYSNYGPELDLVAPGGDMSVDQDGDGEPDGILQQNHTSTWAYRFYEGTSMASPHVAGAAALVLAANPNANVEAALTGTARDLGAAGVDAEFGYGALDAAAAVDRAVAGGTESGAGYWLASQSGQVAAYGTAAAFGSARSRGVVPATAAIEETPTGDGYWLLDVEGGVHAFGAAGYHGSLTDLKAKGAAPSGVRALDISTTPTGQGYWILDEVGGIFTFGDAKFAGSVPGLRNQGVAIGPAQVVDLASTPSGRGYWLLDSVGGMFAFGDASFRGSIPALRNQGVAIGQADIVAMAATGAGGGYWMVDSVGGMFAFGDADYHGSIPGLRVGGVNIGPTSVVAMEPSGAGGGYWLVDGGGGIFTFGTARYHGSFPASGISAHAVGIAPARG